QTHFDSLQTSDASVAYQLGGIAELRRRPLLTADLEDAPGAVHGIAERAALADRERGRLLQIDVLARLHRVDSNDRVPVIGGADDHCVDVGTWEQLAIIAVRRDAVVGLAGLLGVVAVDELFGILHAVGVEIAGRHDPRALVLPDVRQVVPTRNATRSNRADV